MPTAIYWTDDYRADEKHLSSAQRDKFEPVYLSFLKVMLAWTSGPLPIEEFGVEMDVHAVDPGVYAFAWDFDGRCTFTFLDVVDDHPDKIQLLNVGTHADCYQ